MEFTEDELMIIVSLLYGAMQGHNEMIERGHYFSKDQKEMFGIMKGMLNKFEDAEGGK